MKFLKQKFTNYGICYYANDKDDCIAKINCYGNGQKLEKTRGITVTPVFSIKFFKDNLEIPQNEFIPHKRKDDIKKHGPVREINLHYPISRFNDIISILRHERKTCYLIIEDKKDNPKGGLITEGLMDDNEYDIPIK